MPLASPPVTVSVGLLAVGVTVSAVGAPAETAWAVALAAVLAAVAFVLIVKCVRSVMPVITALTGMFGPAIAWPSRRPAVVPLVRVIAVLALALVMERGVETPALR